MVKDKKTVCNHFRWKLYPINNFNNPAINFNIHLNKVIEDVSSILINRVSKLKQLKYFIRYND